MPHYKSHTAIVERIKHNRVNRREKREKETREKKACIINESSYQDGLENTVMKEKACYELLREMREKYIEKESL